jgi:hypothetical protein
VSTSPGIKSNVEMPNRLQMSVLFTLLVKSILSKTMSCEDVSG